ncbi:MAG: uracil-DNA glycosylase [Saprospiraceae bacterium]|jgi:uracil-DNA glycosylase|nr:uracil-DNA glycosylase [Saprospiraceae bacterium]
MEQIPPNTNIQIEASWKQALAEEFQKPYFSDIRRFLHEEIASGKTIYPPGPLIFNAFNKTPFDAVKVVILGQDPYHNPGEAMGLCFSVPRGVKVPPSLVNIYKEIKSELGLEAPGHGDLSRWAEQGVLLLNAMLTVEAKQPASHQKIGWQTFTDAVIKCISDKKDGVVFLLWGNFARSKKHLIDESKHYVLEAAHPSPLAGNAFQGCGHFAYTNEILRKQGSAEIDWAVDGRR